MKQKGMETGEQEVDLENLPTQSGDHLDFLRGANPCVIYLWYKLLSHGLFQTSDAEFPVGLGADGGIAPDILVTSSVAASKEDYKEDTGMNAMAMTIGSLVMTQSKMNREKFTNVFVSIDVRTHRKYSRMSIFVREGQKSRTEIGSS